MKIAPTSLTNKLWVVIEMGYILCVQSLFEMYETLDEKLITHPLVQWKQWQQSSISLGM